MNMKDGRVGTFDGLDNRKTLIDLFERLGRGLDERTAGMRRALFLRGLLDEAEPDWKGKPLRVEPCSAVDAYFLLVGLMSGFGVSIRAAAERLQKAVSGEWKNGEASMRLLLQADQESLPDQRHRPSAAPVRVVYSGFAG